MKPIGKFLSDLDKLGIKLWNDNGQLGYRAPKGVFTPALVDHVRERKKEILDCLRQSETPHPLTIRPVSRSEKMPLSFAQQRLWFLSQLEGGNASYNITGALRLKGVLNQEALEHSLKKIEERHEILRATFPQQDGRAYQKINPPLFRMTFISIEDIPSDEQDARVEDLARKEEKHIFDLSFGSLWRITLLRRTPSHHILFVTLHHIIADGWSMSNFTNELSVLYDALVNEKPVRLPELPVQYIDFAVCQREWLTDDILESQLKYWKKQLADPPSVSTFPSDYPRPAVQSYQGAEISQSFPQSLFRELRQLARKQGVTLFMMLEAAFAVLLSRYSGTDDIMIGTPIANRQHKEIEPLIGFFVNTLVLRHNLSENPGFTDFLQQVQHVALDAYQYQSLPFELLIERIRPERSLSQSPLFQVMFILQNTPDEKRELSGLDLTFINTESSTAKFDLTLSMAESEEGLTGIWEYNTDLFEKDTIQRIASHYKNLLNSIIADPSMGIRELPILDNTETDHILSHWNHTDRSISEHKPVHEMFEEQVGRTPENTALVFENQKLTYRELNAKANQLAHYLTEQNVSKGDHTLSDGVSAPNPLIGIYSRRSPEMIISVLAVLKAGCAYVPLDPGYPKERLEYMLEDAHIDILLTQQTLLSDWPEYAGTLMDLNNIPGSLPVANPEMKADPEDLCYVLYTSGSTGKPKGVAMPHKAASNLIAWQLTNTEILNQPKTTQFAPISFDVSFQEIFSTLCAGGILFLLSEDLRRDPYALLAFIDDKEIDRLFLPYVALQQIAESSKGNMPASLREIITAGEPLKITPAIRDWFDTSDCTLENQYGPTESHVVSSFTLTGKANDWPFLPSMGRPVWNTQLYILDTYLKPVPIGVTGELYIGGLQLAKGYLNRPELTEEKFIPNPFGDGRIYRTGDICRYLPDGNIEYVGRSDFQVKIRGFRIELEEIEGLLSEHESVGDVVVLVREEGDIRKLMAYMTGSADTETLSAYLAEKLPDYMIPSAFVKVEKMPLTPSGKTDRKALSELEVSYQGPLNSNEFIPPRDSAEQQLAHIWQEVLNLPMVGVRENFFEIGGHSLLAVHLMARIEQHFGINLPVATLFQNPRITQLAECLRKQPVHSPWPSLVPIRSSGKNIPFFCVPGAGGNVLCFYELARLMKPDQSFYGLQAKGLDGCTPPHSSIEDMAAHYIQALQSVQAQGPYFIGGHSFGGSVAFEMTQQLLRRGHDIGRLIIIDADAPYAGQNAEQLDEADLLAFLARVYGESRGREPEIEVEALREVADDEKRFHYVSRQMKKAGLLPSDFEIEGLKNIARIFKINLSMEYIPKEVIPVPITHIRAEEGMHLTDPIWDQDKSPGWDNLSDGSAEIISIPGNHYTILAQPHVKLLSEQLSCCLGKNAGKKRFA